MDGQVVLGLGEVDGWMPMKYSRKSRVDWEGQSAAKSVSEWRMSQVAIPLYSSPSI